LGCFIFSTSLVFLSVPPFEITGVLHLVKEALLRDALQALRLPFLALTKGEAVFLPSGARIQSDVMVVNREKTAVLCPAEDCIIP
jgi:hypothetical protein